jgi:hypothetical protein
MRRLRNRRHDTTVPYGGSKGGIAFQEILSYLEKLKCTPSSSVRDKHTDSIHYFQVHNYHNSGHYPPSCPLFKTQLNSIRLSVPHMKHSSSPPRAQQVNAIYRFVMMVY